MAFAKLEPFGFDADMYGHGITSSTIANVNRRKGTKAFKPQDFVPKEKERPTPGAFFQNLKQLLLSGRKNGKNDGNDNSPVDGNSRAR